MKKQIRICAVLLLSVVAVYAQPREHVRWTYSLQKTKDGMDELHLKATIDEGWHIYSQVQPDNSTSIPCSIVFYADSTYLQQGKVREIGKLIRFFDPRSGLGANEYEGTVEFVQTVKFGPQGRREITGELTYQACSGVICLSPKKILFSVK